MVTTITDTSTTENEVRRRTLPFSQVANDVLTDLRLSRDARFLYTILVTYANGSRECFPSRAKLAIEMGTAGSPVSEKSVSRWLTELRKAGWLKVTLRYREDGSRTSNLYTLLDAEHFPSAAERQERLDTARSIGF